MVTVIIPAYNQPDNLRRALHSLSAQTSHNFKVLVCDDCSDVDLRIICDEFPQLPLTYVRADRNRGCGGNRQYALDYFMQEPTEYLMFMDSDDALTPNAVDRLNRIIEHNQADIIATDIIQDSEDIEYKIIPAGNNRTWLHGKIYRSDFIQKHHITFPSIESNEDLAFNLVCYSYAEDIYNVNEAYYMWCNNEHSMTRDASHADFVQRTTSINFIEAVYYAYKQVPRLNSIMLSNILSLYNFYQTAVAFGLMKPRYNKMINEMLHNEEVLETIVGIFYHSDIQLQFKQWAVKDDNLMLFGQSFGQWISSFVSQKEANDAIKKLQKKKKSDIISK